MVSQFGSFWMIGRRIVFTVSTSAPRIERVWVSACSVARLPATKPSAAPAAERTSANRPAAILSPGLGLLADDGRLDQHQREGRERDDGDDPKAFSAERPGSCLHHVTLRAPSRRARLVARMVEPWLRSRA